MRIDDKKVAVQELKDVANKATSAVAADYHGASVTELTKLLSLIHIDAADE